MQRLILFYIHTKIAADCVCVSIMQPAGHLCIDVAYTSRVQLAVNFIPLPSQKAERVFEAASRGCCRCRWRTLFGKRSHQVKGARVASFEGAEGAILGREMQDADIH